MSPFFAELLYYTAAPMALTVAATIYFFFARRMMRKSLARLEAMDPDRGTPQ